MGRLFVEDIESYQTMGRIDRAIVVGDTKAVVRGIPSNISGAEIVIDAHGANPETVTVTAQDDGNLYIRPGDITNFNSDPVNHFWVDAVFFSTQQRFTAEF